MENLYIYMNCTNTKEAVICLAVIGHLHPELIQGAMLPLNLFSIDTGDVFIIPFWLVTVSCLLFPSFAKRMLCLFHVSSPHIWRPHRLLRIEL